MASTPEQMTMFGVVAANAGGDGFRATAAAGGGLQDSQFHNMVIAHNSDGAGSNGIGYSISWDLASNNTFSGFLKVGGNEEGDCSVTGGTNPGLDNSCASGATLTTSVGLGGDFVADVTTDDAVNPDDTNGEADAANAASYAFENRYRTWGQRGTTSGTFFPDPSTRGGCYSTDTCRIYDWSLLDVAGAIHAVIGVPDGDTTMTHTWSNASTTTFLDGAVEIMGDGIGNDNALCESDETCLYTPNVGAYQGHGALVSQPFTDSASGGITGVTLLKYETNGY